MDKTVGQSGAETESLILVHFDYMILDIDFEEVKRNRAYLQQHFVIKDMKDSRYFLSGYQDHSWHAWNFIMISLSERKYALD